MSKERIDFLWKVIGRYDFYINSTNTKANFLIAFNTFIIGGQLANFSSNTKELANFPVLKGLSGVLIFISFAAAITCLWFTLKVVNPFLKSNKKAGEYHSSIFFKDVAEHESPEAFHQKILKEAEADQVKDLAYQTHILAKGTSLKFDHLKNALIAILFAQIPALILLLCIRFLALFMEICQKAPQ